MEGFLFVQYSAGVGLSEELCIGRDRKKSRKDKGLRDGWLTTRKNMRG